MHLTEEQKKLSTSNWEGAKYCSSGGSGSVICRCFVNPSCFQVIGSTVHTLPKQARSLANQKYQCSYICSLGHIINTLEAMWAQKNTQTRR